MPHACECKFECGRGRNVDCAHYSTSHVPFSALQDLARLFPDIKGCTVLVANITWVAGWKPAKHDQHVCTYVH